MIINKQSQAKKPGLCSKHNTKPASLSGKSGGHTD
jgi:hypothetical protein